MAEFKVEPHESSLNMEANVAALIVYIATVVASWIPGVRYFAWAVPLVFFFVEKKSPFVRFHAMQAFVLNLSGVVLWIALGLLGGAIGVLFVASIFIGAMALPVFLAGLLAFLAVVVSILMTVFMIIAMVKAYGYKEYKIPLIGEWAEKLGARMSKSRNV